MKLTIQAVVVLGSLSFTTYVSSCVKKTVVEGNNAAGLVSNGKLKASALSQSIKIMNYNIQSGIGIDGVCDINRTASVILASGADVISLNEVAQNFNAETNWTDEPVALVNYMTTHTGSQWYYAFQSTTTHSTTHNGLPEKFGHMVLSRFPIDSVRTLQYAANDGVHYRGILETWINNNGNKFYFYSTHLGLGAAERASQIQQMLQFTGERAGPKIIAGDMNFLPSDPDHASMAAKYADPLGTSLTPYTFKSSNPTSRIDYFWGPSQVTFSNVAAITTTQASDHFPLVGDASLNYSEVNIMQYNINHGEGTDGVYNLQRIISVIKNANPDVVVLNEVDRNYDPRSNYDDELKILADSLHMYAEFQKTTYKSAIPASHNKERQFGHGVLSKFPIGDSSTQGRWIYTQFDTHYEGLLKVRLDICGNPIYLYITQLGTDPSERASQASEAVSFINPPNYTWKVLAGDINDTPGSTPVNTFLTILSDCFTGQTAYTYPANSPGSRLDYIMAKSTMTTSGTGVISSTASTHLPIKCKLTMH